MVAPPSFGYVIWGFNMRFINSCAPALCVIVSSFALTAPASAQQHERRVAYHDLDLDTETGARAMLSRISRAANDICGDNDGPMPLWERSQLRECRNDIVAHTVAQLNRPMVTALLNRDPVIFAEVQR